MASYGFTINLPIPTSGQASWDGPLNNLLQAIVNVLAQRVTPMGMNINANLDLGGNMLVDAAALEFIPATSDPGVANSVFVAGPGSGLANGEWYVRDGANREIQLTSGGAINLTVNGGFGGQYVSAGAVASYNAGNDTYYFTTNGTTAANINAAQGTFSAVTASAGVFTTLTTSTFPASGYGLLVSNATGTLSTIQSGSVVQWVDIAQGIASVGSPTYSSTSGWTLGASGTAIDIPLAYVQGDSLQSFTYYTAGSYTTAGLMYRGPNLLSQIAGASFQLSTTNVMNSVTPGLIGTLPFTPGVSAPATGTLFIRITCGSSIDVVHDLNVTWLRKMI